MVTNKNIYPLMEDVMEDLSGEIHKIRYYLMELGWDMDPAVDSAVEVPDEWK